MPDPRSMDSPEEAKTARDQALDAAAAGDISRRSAVDHLAQAIAELRLSGNRDDATAAERATDALNVIARKHPGVADYAVAALHSAS